ncbi:MAG: aminopeptidase P N-terminal domain-containing protein [Armatimonadetes bacterium]|nr:aminopeptidase P N-terminal domain-containing protein [Armatimonadota bacterium]
MFSAEAISARRKRVEAHLGLSDQVLIVDAGLPIGQPSGMDQTYDYRVHADYYWLTGSRRPGGVIAYDPGAGWTHFVVPVTEAERVWEGVTVEPVGEDVELLAGYLKERESRKVIRLGGSDPKPTREFEAELWHLRRPKDSEELAVMRQAAIATAAGHAKIAEICKPGLSERRAMIEIEAEFMRNGSERPGYNTTVGIGSDAAVLHFTPTARELKEGDVMLVDAGASVDGYIIDVTRTYGAHSGFAKDLYGVVLASILKGNSLCRKGVEWVDVHYACCEVIADGLRGLGILNCSAEIACESGLIALFMPHGIGHAVGLGVRDCSGPYPGRESGFSCGAGVRCNFPLEPGYVMTVEPGCYFMPPLLNKPANRSKFAGEVNWSRVDEVISVGGVRLEDNMLVTEGDPENLTGAIPK